MPRTSPQSAQRYPLTGILGTEANVRLLRELSRHGGQLSAPSLVARSGLGKTSVWASLAALEAAGILTSAGSGRVHLYQIRSGHPLTPALHALFEAEEQRFQAILDAVRAAAENCGRSLDAVWIYGSVARGEDGPDSDLDVVFVGDTRPAFDQALTTGRELLSADGEKLGFRPAVVGLVRADVLRLAEHQDPWWLELERDALGLSGPRPSELASRLRAAARGIAA